MGKRIAKITTLLLLIGGMIFGGVELYKSYKAKNGQKKPAMRTMKVERGGFSLVVSTTGVVEPRFVVEIRSKASGEIKSINFEEGDRVKKGQLLIQLDTTLEQRRVNQALADLNIAKANHSKARNLYKHTSGKYQTELKLYKKRLVSRESIINLKSDLTVRRSEIAITRAKVKKAEEVLEEAKDRLSDTRIVAPSDGVVLHRYVNPGQIIFSGSNSVSGGTTLAKMADLDQLYVRVDVDEADVAHIRAGMQTQITVDALPDQRFRGRIIRVNPEGKTSNNVTVFETIVKLELKASKVLRVQMTANVKIRVQNLRKVLTVPSVALRNQGGKTGVFKMQGGKTRFLPIAISYTNGTKTVVTEGLKEGDTIVVAMVTAGKKGNRRGGRFNMFNKKKSGGR